MTDVHSKMYLVANEIRDHNLTLRVVGTQPHLDIPHMEPKKGTPGFTGP